MRALVVLFALNMLMAGWIWTDLRAIKSAPSFLQEDGAVELVQIKSGKGCLLVGPSKNGRDAEMFVQSLADTGLFAKTIERKQEVAPRYWVYIPALKDYAGSLALQAELNAKGVDNFIIHHDELYGALSVGVFENIDSAERMQSVMTRKGYRVSIRNIFNYESSWWVQIEAAADQKNINEISRIAMKYGLPRQMREIFCKTVASEKSLP